MARVYQKNQTDKAQKTVPRSKRKKNFTLVPRSCFGQLMFVLVVLVFGAGLAIARTGLWDVPVLTPLFYQPAQPSRIVNVDETALKTVGPMLSGTLEQYRSEGRDDLPLSEANLTSLLQKAIIEQKNSPISDLQAVIEPNGIEISGQYHTARRPYRFFVTVWPSVNKGKMSFSVKQVRLEGLALPAALGNMIVHNYMPSSEAELNKALAQYLTVSNIRLSSRTAIVTGKIQQTNLPF